MRLSASAHLIVAAKPMSQPVVSGLGTPTRCIHKSGYAIIAWRRAAQHALDRFTTDATSGGIALALLPDSLMSVRPRRYAHMGGRNHGASRASSREQSRSR